jgi:hypothetical protein
MEDTIAVIYSIGRVYDVLLLLLTELNPDVAGDLRSLHEESKLYFPPFGVDDAKTT